MIANPIERAFGTLFQAYMLWALYVLGKKYADTGKTRCYLYAVLSSVMLSVCVIGSRYVSDDESDGASTVEMISDYKGDNQTILNDLIYYVIIAGAPLLVGVYQGRKEIESREFIKSMLK